MSEKTEGQRRIDGYRLVTESLQKHARKMGEARRAAAERDARESAVCYDPSHDALTDERDEAVRERDELRAKAELVDKIFASGYMDPVEYTLDRDDGCYVCLFCGGVAWSSDMVDHPSHCPAVEYDSLTPDKAAQETKDGEG